MIDEDLIEPARKLAAHGLRALDNAAQLVAGHYSDPVGIVDGISRAGSLDRSGSPIGDGDLGDDEPASLVRSREIMLQPFEVRHGRRRRDSVVLLHQDGSFLALFAIWNAFSQLVESVGPDGAAAAVMTLPADRLLGLARAYVRGNFERADQTLRLTEAAGSGRAWSELSASAAPLSPFRITEKVAAHA